MGFVLQPTHSISSTALCILPGVVRASFIPCIHAWNGSLAFLHGLYFLDMPVRKGADCSLWELFLGVVFTEICSRRQANVSIMTGRRLAYCLLWKWSIPTSQCLLVVTIYWACRCLAGPFASHLGLGREAVGNDTNLLMLMLLTVLCMINKVLCL